MVILVDKHSLSTGVEPTYSRRIIPSDYTSYNAVDIHEGYPRTNLS